MIKTYAKGAAKERELLHHLDSKGFSVIRAASSGCHLYPADVVAMRRGNILALECKAWSKKPSIEREKLERFAEWCRAAGATGFIAWRTSSDWLFLRLEDAIARKTGDENWVGLQTFLKIFCS